MSNQTKFQLTRSVYLKEFNFVVLILLLIPLLITAQTKQAHSLNEQVHEPVFQNQGEQEDYWAKQLFERDYKSERYKKDKPQFVLNGNYYRYGDVVIAVRSDRLLSSIVENGLFYPNVIAKAYQYQPKLKIKIDKDSLSAWKKRAALIKNNNSLINSPHIDTLMITSATELKFIETTPKRKRFKF